MRPLALRAAKTIKSQANESDECKSSHHLPQFLLDTSNLALHIHFNNELGMLKSKWGEKHSKETKKHQHQTQEQQILKQSGRGYKNN